MTASPENKIVLGTVQFGLNYGINNQSGKPGMNEVKNILDLAYGHSIRLLDTAEAYGNAHEVIGSYHTDSTNRFEVITKFSARRNDLPERLGERIAQHLSVLSVSSLYSYMFHSFGDFETHYPAMKSELEELKAKGTVKKIGVSIYTNTELEALITYDGIDLVQLPFNLLDNFTLRHHLIERAKKKGIEIHTRSVFLQGLFFKQNETLPEKLKPLGPYLQQIRSISSSGNIGLNQMALNYAIHQPEIDRVLIGVDTAAQLKENLAALAKGIAPETVSAIDQLIVKETELLNPANWNA